MHLVFDPIEKTYPSFHNILNPFLWFLLDGIQFDPNVININIAIFLHYLGTYSVQSIGVGFNFLNHSLAFLWKLNLAILNNLSNLELLPPLLVFQPNHLRPHDFVPKTTHPCLEDWSFWPFPTLDLPTASIFLQALFYIHPFPDCLALLLWLALLHASLI